MGDWDILVNATEGGITGFDSYQYRLDSNEQFVLSISGSISGQNCVEVSNGNVGLSSSVVSITNTEDRTCVVDAGGMYFTRGTPYAIENIDMRPTAQNVPELYPTLSGNMGVYMYNYKFPSTATKELYGYFVKKSYHANGDIRINVNFAQYDNVPSATAVLVLTYCEENSVGKMLSLSSLTSMLTVMSASTSGIVLTATFTITPSQATFCPSLNFVIARVPDNVSDNYSGSIYYTSTQISVPLLGLCSYDIYSVYPQYLSI